MIPSTQQELQIINKYVSVNKISLLDNLAGLIYL